MIGRPASPSVVAHATHPDRRGAGRRSQTLSAGWRFALVGVAANHVDLHDFILKG